MKKIIIPIISSIIIIALAAYFFLFRKIEIFGEKYILLTRSISISEDNTKDLDLIISELDKLPFLRTVDLGNSMLDEESAIKLKDEFPKINFNFILAYKVFDKFLPADAASIDISEDSFDSIDELCAGISKFKNLEKIKISGDALSKSYYDKLSSEFPKLKIDAAFLFELCGKTFRSDDEKIDLSNTSIDASISESLKKFTNLKYVDIHSTPLSDDEKIELIKKFPDIKFGLNAKICGKNHNTEEESFDFNDIKITDLDAFKKSLILFPDVKKIEMCDCGISNEDMEKLKNDFPKIKFVWRVHMGQWSLKTDAKAFSVLIYKYDYTRLTSKDIEVLKYCTELEALDIGHQSVTDISVIGNYLPNLKILILADNRVSDLTPLSKLKHLHYLEIFVNQVTDVSPLAQCKELIDLNISYNYKLADISPLLDLPLLERFWFEHNAASNSANYKLFKDKFPNAEIYYQGEGSIDNGWRTHERYFEMIKMFHNDYYVSEAFTKYDGK